jgi:alkaline phosphatase
MLAGTYDNTHVFEAMYKALTLDQAVLLPLILSY